MYKSLFRNFFNPFFERVIKRRKVLLYLNFLEKSQNWSYAKLLEFQLCELKRLLVHAYTNVPFWNNQFRKLGVSVEEAMNYKVFQELPIINKQIIRENFQQMKAVNFKGQVWGKSTGGSTGEPLYFQYTPESYDWRVAVSKRGYSWAGCEDGIKQAYIWGDDLGKTQFLKQTKKNLHRCFLRHKYFNCFNFGRQEMERAVKDMNKFKPEIIVGYANPLFNFAKFVRDRKKINFQLKSIISAAEKLHDFQRKEIEDVFGCEVFATYGSREFMLIASECEEHCGLHINMENLFVEIIKEDGSPALEGEIGEVVVTDLHNFAMPFIRYKIGDMAISTNKVCPCKRGLPLLADVTGRSLDMIVSIDGKYIAGEFFPHLMKDYKEVKKFQVLQDKEDHLVVKIIKAEVFSDSRLNLLKQAILHAVGQKMQVDILFVDDIPLTPSGKYRITVSELNK